MRILVLVLLEWAEWIIKVKAKSFQDIRGCPYGQPLFIFSVGHFSFNILIIKCLSGIQAFLTQSIPFKQPRIYMILSDAVLIIRSSLYGCWANSPFDRRIREESLKHKKIREA